MRFVLCFAVFAASFAITFAACSAVTPESVVMPPEVWLVQTQEGGSGSATLLKVVGDQIWFLTAAHVLPVVSVGGLQVDLQIAHQDYDIAILRARTGVPGLYSEPSIRPPPLSHEPVSCLGWHQGEFLMLTTGHTAVSRRPTTTCYTTSGCSGGAVFDRHDNLIGIINSVSVQILPTLRGDSYAMVLNGISHYTPVVNVLPWAAEQISAQQ